MALVPDSAPVFSLDEKYFNVHIQKEVGQSRDITVKMSARAGMSTNPSSSHCHCVAASGSCRQWGFFAHQTHPNIPYWNRLMVVISADVKKTQKTKQNNPPQTTTITTDKKTLQFLTLVIGREAGGRAVM